jgi:uncharacterized protein YecT (DUF1311 family)
MINKFITALILGAIALSSHHVTTNKSEKLMAETIKCNKSGTTIEMKQCAAEEYKIADQKLNLVYKQLISQLKGEQKKRLIDAEVAWINFRDKSCNFESADALGGTLEGLIYANCLVRMTNDRTTYFENYIKERNSR